MENESERIKEVRKANGLTMEKFAVPLGVGKTAISKIESGERGVTDQIRRSIAREYHVNYEWLLTGEGEMKTSTSRSDELDAFFQGVRIDDGFKSRFVRALAQLNERDWGAVEKMARSIYEQELSKNAEASDENHPSPASALDDEEEAVRQLRESMRLEKEAAAASRAS